MKAEQLRQWLMQMPRPHTVRVTDEHGGIQDVVCGQSTWVKVSETIEAMRPDLLQAMSAEKAVLRACRPNDLSEDWSADDAEPRRATVAPIDVPIEKLDPESARFALFARLLSDAYKHSTNVAFERLADLVEAQSKRAESVDRTREAMYRAHVKQLEDQIKQSGQEPVEGPNDVLQAVIGGLLQGAMGGGVAAPAPAAPTNGKAS